MGAERGGIEVGRNEAWFLPSTLRQQIRVTRATDVEAVLHGLRVEAGRSTWHGAARSALQRPRACTQGRNGQWASCPGGLGSVL
jgi:hypothetical protein